MDMFIKKIFCKKNNILAMNEGNFIFVIATSPSMLDSVEDNHSFLTPINVNFFPVLSCCKMNTLKRVSTQNSGGFGIVRY